MAGNVYALLAGINDYEGRLKTLDGCVNDINGFHDFLEGRLDKRRRHIVTLTNGDATRANIITGFTDHLARAGKDDVAVFYFSGHGSEEPVDERYWYLEPTKRNQTIVCADSRRPGVPDLADKELNELLAVAAADGVHVLVVLDCCHSGSGTRDPNTLPTDVRARFAPANERPRDFEAYLPRMQMTWRAASRDAGSGPPTVAAARHIALSACESTQLALELPIGDTHRGVFSAMLQRAMTILGPHATYRDLLGAASTAVRDRVYNQQPVGYATELDDLDQPLFGGAVLNRRAAVALEHVHGTWWINAGTVHGIQPPRGADTTVLAVLPHQNTPDRTAPDREQPLGHVRVENVEPTQSQVTVDDGWQPDPEARYRATVIDVPLPPATVELRGDPVLTAQLRTQLAGSPHLREGVSDPGSDGDRFVVLAEDDALTVARADASALTTPLPATPAGIRTVVARLEHLTRWHVIKRLDNPLSTIAGQVEIHIVPAHRHEQPPLPGHREALTAASDGCIHLHYQHTTAGWQQPYIFIYLHNASDRDLYCALLNLTDRFRSHSRLFPGNLIPAGTTAVAHEGRPIAVSIPQDRLESGGTEVYDWLKLVAAEQRFAADAYELPTLDGILKPRTKTRGRGPRTILDRLADRAVTRDVGAEPTELPEWTTTLVNLHTSLSPDRAITRPMTATIRPGRACMN